MTSPQTEEWIACVNPELNDTLKWNEPLWAVPNKPRGKPDKIGEQEIIATLVSLEEVLEFKVISVRKISSGDAELKVQKDDNIRRKKSTLEKGFCHKLVN